MSLIVVDKYNDYLAIFSDTKITFEAMNKIPNEVEHNILKYGCLKSYIISDNVCISFAGQLYYMNLFMKWFIDDMDGNCSINQVVNKLVELNIRSNNSTDFIIGILGDSNAKILLVQNGEHKDVNNAWIGDYDAFRLYQEKKFHYENEISKINEKDKFLKKYVLKNLYMNFGSNGSIGMIIKMQTKAMTNNFDYQKWYYSRAIAFSEIVDSNIIPTVGKYFVQIITNDKHIFSHITEYSTNQKLKFNILDPKLNGKTLDVPATGCAIYGDYSYRIAPINNNKGICIDIAEISKTIQFDFFQYEDVNLDYDYLLLPKVFSLDKNTNLLKSIGISDTGVYL